MATHTLRLHPEPFDEIARGGKTIELRLFDEKRQQMRIGDKLQFVDRRDEQNIITTQIVGLVRAASFAELLENDEIARASGPHAQWLNDQLSQFYSIEDQRKYGAIGIKFTLDV
jgi:ASC-1-like (ASCH) protein